MCVQADSILTSAIQFSRDRKMSRNIELGISRTIEVDSQCLKAFYYNNLSITAFPRVVQRYISFAKPAS